MPRTWATLRARTQRELHNPWPQPSVLAEDSPTGPMSAAILSGAVTPHAGAFGQDDSDDDDAAEAEEEAAALKLQAAARGKLAREEVSAKSYFARSIPQTPDDSQENYRQRPPSRPGSRPSSRQRPASSLCTPGKISSALGFDDEFALSWSDLPRSMRQSHPPSRPDSRHSSRSVGRSAMTGEAFFTGEQSVHGGKKTRRSIRGCPDVSELSSRLLNTSFSSPQLQATSASRLAKRPLRTSLDVQRVWPPYEPSVDPAAGNLLGANAHGHTPKQMSQDFHTRLKGDRLEWSERWGMYPVSHHA